MVDRQTPDRYDTGATSASAAGLATPEASSDPTGSVSVVRSEERLLTGVERVPVERVRIVRYIVTEQVTRTVEVRHEEVRIEQVPFEGPQSALPPSTDALAPLEILLHDEEVVLSTRVVPRERVVVSVERVRSEAPVSAQLSHEEVAVDTGEGLATDREGFPR